ncbi:MAG: MFS transporter [Bradyrhizobium sp.]
MTRHIESQSCGLSADTFTGDEPASKPAAGVVGPDQRVSGAFGLTLALCFCAIVLDGLDTGSIGVAGPAIAAHFNVGSASLTLPFVSTSIGAVIGYVSSGFIASRLGDRRVLSASVFAFGCLSLITPHAPTLTMLSLLRLITAIGLGAALPCAIAIAAAQAPPRLRASATILVGAGLAAGGALGGVLGGVLTKTYGWEWLFYVGGVLPLILALALVSWLPKGPAQAPRLGTEAFRRAGYLAQAKSLLADGLAVGTLALWAFSFLIFLDAYALIFWLPTLLIGFGLSPAQAQFGAGFFSSGGLLANLLVIAIVSRLAVPRVMLIAVVLATICAAGLAMQGAPSIGLFVLIGGTGAGLIACSVGQAALAVSMYPEALRINGVGFSAASGRLGSILGPAIAGALVSSGYTPQSIVLTSSVPLLAATAVVLLLLKSVPRSVAREQTFESGTPGNHERVLGRE